MATAAQISANQTNAQKSTGPVTAQGKETASRNSTTHGLTSTKVMPNEVVTFDQLLQGFTKLYNPQTDIERALVRRCADFQVRIDRALNAEAAFMNECVNRIAEENAGIGYEEALGLLFLDQRYAPKMSLVLRYQAQASRGYNQTKKELEQLIDARLRAEAIAQELVAGIEAAAQDDEMEKVSRNGFVSQTSHEPQTAPVAPTENAQPRP